MEEYREQFALNLSYCERQSNLDASDYDLKECCKICQDLKQQLVGMVILLKHMLVITDQEYDEEINRIYNAFSTRCYSK